MNKIKEFAKKHLAVAGDKTIMERTGTPLPILDFKSLYSLLKDEYRIVVENNYLEKNAKRKYLLFII